MLFGLRAIIPDEGNDVVIVGGTAEVETCISGDFFNELCERPLAADTKKLEPRSVFAGRERLNRPAASLGRLMADFPHLLFAPQNNQLMSERRVLCFKPALRLNRRY
jgi:hypothetical protein